MSGVRVDLVILACAISAGIHGALVPEHLEEGLGAGGGFVASTVLLAGFAVVLTRRPASRAALGAAALSLGGLVVAYGLAVTTGLPLLHPEPEPVDGLGLVTKAVEIAGLAAAASLLRRPATVLKLDPKGA